MGVLTTVKRRGRAPLPFESKTEMLISVMSEKGIKIVPGDHPATDCEGRVFMPPLPEDATEEDILKYFVSAAHEQSHFHGKSDLSKKPRNKIKGFCLNVVEDIRCENLQEQEYPGLKKYRVEEYNLDCSSFLKDELEGASKEDLMGLVTATLKYTIVKSRARKLADVGSITVYASSDVLELYRDIILDLEDSIDAMVEFGDAVTVSDKIYKRIRKLIKDHVSDEYDKSKALGACGEDEEGEESEGGSSDESSKASIEDYGSGAGEDSSDISGGSSDTSGGSSEDDSSCSSDTGEDSLEDSEDSLEDSAEERKKAIKKKIDSLIRDVSSDALKTIADKYSDDIVDMTSSDGRYTVANGVEDIVIEAEPNVREGTRYVKLGKEVLGVKGSRLGRLFVSNTKERYLYNQMSGRFDMRSFCADPLDRRQAIYKTTIPGSLEKACVSFAIDNSGSMSGSRIGAAYTILAGMLYYLDKAGVPTEAIGFTATTTSSSMYRDGEVIHTIIKEFNEPFNKKAIARCHPPASLMQNVELEALKFLAPRLWARPEKKKILFVLSDGDPAFGPPSINRKMGVAYKEYIERLKKAGVIVFGFGMDGCDVSPYFGEDSLSGSASKIGILMVDKLTEVLNRKR